MTVGEHPVENRPDDRWFLTDQREFLLRSLEDAHREHEAGDLSDEDHGVLVARDSARLAEVEAELATLGPAVAPVAPSAAEATERAESEGTAAGDGTPGGDGTPEAAVTRAPMALWRKVAIVACCLLIVFGAVSLLTHFLRSAQPGQPLSGSISQSAQQQIEQQLDEALQANNRGDVGTALNLYDQVLSEDPSDPNALAYAGYLQWNIGSKSHVTNLVKIGRAEIEKAVHVSPSNPEGHLFYGLVLGQPGPQRRRGGRAVQRLSGRWPAGGADVQGVGRRGALLPGGGATLAARLRHTVTIDHHDDGELSSVRRADRPPRSGRTRRKRRSRRPRSSSPR